MNRGIACIGNLIIDVIKEIESFPAAGNLTTITAVGETTGGLICNCLLDIHNMDSSVPLTAVGLIGADAYGEKIVSSLSAAGIEVSHIRKHPSLGTSFTDVMNQSGGGERTFFQYRGANAAFAPGHIPLDEIQADILHFGYILLLDTLDGPDAEYGTLMARVLHDAQKKGFKTSIDIVSEQSERFVKIVPPALKYTDYCVVNEIEASAAAGIPCRDGQGKLQLEQMEPLCRALKAMGVGEWAVIHCPEGGFAVDGQGRYFAQPSVNIVKSEIKGKTGAGDAFCSAILYCAYKDIPLPEALKLAGAAAVACLRDKSATAGVLPVDELWSLIEQSGFEQW